MSEKISAEEMRSMADRLSSITEPQWFRCIMRNDMSDRRELADAKPGLVAMLLSLATEREQEQAGVTDQIVDLVLRRTEGNRHPFVPGQGTFEDMRAALEAVAPMLRGVPDGMVLVPVNLPFDVLGELGAYGDTGNPKHIWDAALRLLTASPKHVNSRAEHAPIVPTPEVDECCRRVMRAHGKPYPRTCSVCGLFGECRVALDVISAVKESNL